MSPRHLSPYDRALDACLGDDVELRVCRWVAQRIVESREQRSPTAFAPFEVLPEVIYRMLDSSDESHYSKIIEAFHKMSLNSIGMLEMRYEWHEDSADILAMPVPVNGRDVADALRTGVMYSPVSGELIRDFSSHVHVIYMARTDKDPYQVAEE